MLLFREDMCDKKQFLTRNTVSAVFS